jgi:FixJ family two-component response regulator
VLKSIISAAAKGEAVSSLTNKQIAYELAVGEVTVKMHRSSTM